MADVLGASARPPEFPGAPHTLVPDNLIGINSHGPAQQQRVGIHEAPASQPPTSFPLMIPAACADSVEDSLVIVCQCLWVVAVSCLVTGCLGSFADRIPLDPTTVEDLRRQVPVYSESDTREYVLLQPLSATSCQNKFWDHAPTQEEATDQLRAKAARLGGNGLVHVGCEASDMGMTYVSKHCWAWLTCHGTAIQVTR